MINSSTVETEDYDSEDFDMCCDDTEFLEDYEFDDLMRPCPACFGTGLDRELDSDCMNCWGDGVV